jgi:hypothetical protein
MRLALTLTLFALIASTAVAATPRARLVVMTTSPVSVQGTGFRAGERVTVTLMAGDTRRKAVTANAQGRFGVRFSGVSIQPCEGYFIRAEGRRGSLAVFKVMPACAEQGTDR